MSAAHGRPVFLVVGANGQVGYELVRALQAHGDVRSATRAAWDLMIPGTAARMIRETAPSVVVNAAAYTAVDAAEKESDQAACERLNHGWVAELGAACRESGSALVHYSTDYVFDGASSEPYTEQDATAPLGVYGATKLAGERSALEAGAPALVFRVAWVYGLRGTNFFRTVERLTAGADDAPLRMVADQVGAPTWARAIAEGTALALAAARSLGAGNVRAGMERIHGLYHMGSAGSASWADFAEAIVRGRAAAGLAPARTIERISSAEYPTPARRPANSRLASARLAEWSGVVLPDWTRQLELVIADAVAIRNR